MKYFFFSVCMVSFFYSSAISGSEEKPLIRINRNGIIRLTPLRRTTRLHNDPSYFSDDNALEKNALKSTKPLEETQSDGDTPNDDRASSTK